MRRRDRSSRKVTSRRPRAASVKAAARVCATRYGIAVTVDLNTTDVELPASNAHTRVSCARGQWDSRGSEHGACGGPAGQRSLHEDAIFSPRKKAARGRSMAATLGRQGGTGERPML